MSADSFPFIVSSGPKLQNDPSIRAVIRKQAMKDVGNARRKRNRPGRGNLNGEPNLENTDARIRIAADSDSPVESSSTASSDSSRTADDNDYDELVTSQSVISRRKNAQTTRLDDAFSFAGISLSSNYETARSRFQIDVIDLSMLTYFHVGRSTIPILAADRSYLASLLGHRQWSYLEYIPSRYGTSDCLTAATNCVLAKVKSILDPQAFQCKETMFYLYAKALQTLQDAISNERACLDADVLCATQLLSIHELLDPSRDSAWAQHINGSIRLVKSRTPERFETEFEKALFAAHIGPVLTQALTDMAPCYLEQPEWTKLYRSLIKDTKFLHDRSALTINIRSLMFPIPRLWHDTDKVIRGSRLFDDDALNALKIRCLKSQQDLLDWMEDYKSHCVRLSLTSPPPRELALRRELFGSSLEGLLIVKRLLAIADDQDRDRLETESQALAHLLLELQEQEGPKYSWLFSGHEVGIAYTTIQTRDQWEGNFKFDSDYERRMAIRSRYDAWASMLRRFD